MNLFKKIGNIFSKMTTSRKTEKVAEQLIQQENTKMEQIRDIEDVVSGSKSQFFSPIQTRNQRIKNTTEVKPIPSLVSQAVLQNSTDVRAIRSVKDLKKATEKKDLLDDLKKLPMHIDGPQFEVMQEVVAQTDTKPGVDKPKRKPRVSKKAAELEILHDHLMKYPADYDGPIEFVKYETRDVVPLRKSAKANKKTDELGAIALPKAKKSPKKLSNAVELESVDKDVSAETSPSIVAVKGKRKSKDSPTTSGVKLEKWEPNNWNEVLENIKSMRAGVDAPVDTMGCHKCSDESADEKTQRFHKLVALMLSSQTKDQVTFEAMGRLKENTCTPANIAEMDAKKLETLIYPVSFYKNKAKYLKNTSEILVDQYNSDIPNNLKELIKLPGVGPKMAHICMSTAWDIVTGIGVDVHVHRISNRLGWVRNETKDPEKTRKELESWLPSDKWREVNYLLVGFGQTVCTPTKPKCGECLNSALCPSANQIKRAKPKKEKAV